MLEFFRKYQTYFFLMITVVIVISFSFFGTYNAIPASSIHEQIAFTAIDGTQVSRRELEEMVVFISSDNEDKTILGGIWGPNFLNNGVISKDILETGLANNLIAAYPELVQADLELRLEKEKRFNLYAHPRANFISVDGAWSYIAPEMKTDYDILTKSNDAISPNAFTARVDLYLNEKKFPPQLLKQVLRYQQKQFSWIAPDPNLDRMDLSLFGYHSLSDWFGPRFVRMTAEFIINASKIASEKGYVVSKEEAVADLQRNAEISFKQNLKNPQLGVSNSHEYLQEQLRRLSMDQTKAVKIWQQVMLFRRLFHDIGDAVLIDPITYQQFYAFAKETVQGDLYKLPAEFRFADYRQMQKLEIYLKNISKNYKNDLTLPAQFLTQDQIKKKTPGLVEKKYTLLVTQVAKKSLQAKVPLKEIWNWEVEEKNWEKLKKEFPDLGIKKGSTRDERLASLDDLDNKTRGRVDLFASTAIIDAHPEWITEALQNTEPKAMNIGIRLQGGRTLFGLENREELLKLLEQAPLVNEIATTEEAKQAQEKLSLFSGDNHVFYRIAVVARDPKEEILSFAEANKEGVLDQLLDQELEEYYTKNRQAKGDLFQNTDKTWKLYADVTTQVADLYFEKLLGDIKADYQKANSKEKVQQLTNDRLASLRFYSHMRDAKEKLLQEKPKASKDPLALQWALEKIDYKTDRSQEAGDIDVAELFVLPESSWTLVHAPVNGDLYFIKLEKRAPTQDQEGQIAMLNEAKDLLSDEAQQAYSRRFIEELKSKGAISLDYLNNGIDSDDEMSEPEPAS